MCKIERIIDQSAMEQRISRVSKMKGKALTSTCLVREFGNGMMNLVSVTAFFYHVICLQNYEEEP